MKGSWPDDSWSSEDSSDLEYDTLAMNFGPRGAWTDAGLFELLNKAGLKPTLPITQLLEEASEVWNVDTATAGSLLELALLDFDLGYSWYEDDPEVFIAALRAAERVPELQARVGGPVQRTLQRVRAQILGLAIPYGPAEKRHVRDLAAILNTAPALYSVLRDGEYFPFGDAIHWVALPESSLTLLLTVFNELSPLEQLIWIEWLLDETAEDSPHRLRLTALALRSRLRLGFSPVVSRGVPEVDFLLSHADDEERSAIELWLHHQGLLEVFTNCTDARQARATWPCQLFGPGAVTSDPFDLIVRLLTEQDDHGVSLWRWPSAARPLAEASQRAGYPTLGRRALVQSRDRVLSASASLEYWEEEPGLTKLRPVLNRLQLEARFEIEILNAAIRGLTGSALSTYVEHGTIAHDVRVIDSETLDPEEAELLSSIQPFEPSTDQATSSLEDVQDPVGGLVLAPGPARGPLEYWVVGPTHAGHPQLARPLGLLPGNPWQIIASEPPKAETAGWSAMALRTSPGRGTPESIDVLRLPRPRDEDGDGIEDRHELRLGLDPKEHDSDGDGIADPDDLLPGGTGLGSPRDALPPVLWSALLGKPDLEAGGERGPTPSLPKTRIVVGKDLWLDEAIVQGLPRTLHVTVVDETMLDQMDPSVREHLLGSALLLEVVAWRHDGNAFFVEWTSSSAGGRILHAVRAESEWRAQWTVSTGGCIAFVETDVPLEMVLSD